MRLFIETRFRLLALTFYVDRAPAGQHHNVGRWTGWAGWLHRCSYGHTAGRRGAGGGAGGACVGVTYNHCRKKISCAHWLIIIFKKMNKCLANWCGLTFFVSRFRWQQKGGVLDGCGVGHSVGRHREGRLRDQPWHERDQTAAFDAPFRGAVRTRHAAKHQAGQCSVQNHLLWRASLTTDSAGTSAHLLVGDGGESFIVDSPADLGTMALCWDTGK